MNNHVINDQLPPPPVPFQPPRSSFTCDRHHNDTFTGFCHSCLSERLTILDQPTTSTTAAADLRRTKSFSVSNTKQLSVSKPQRKSCDVSTFDDTNVNDLEDEIVEMEAKIDEIVDNLKSFNLDSNPRKSNFWTKKWKKWRNKSNGYGGRSCDIDSRVLFDKPRASWDGYMVGRSFPRLNVNLPQRSDMHIPVDLVPGGSIQTREYYFDSSKRRKSLDRSNSIRKMSEVSPGIICRSRFHSFGGENELGSELFNKESSKKSRWWRWKVLGFLNRKAGNPGDNTKLSRSSSSVSWRNTKSNSIENKRRIGDEFVFKRNASARYSPFGKWKLGLTEI